MLFVSEKTFTQFILLEDYDRTSLHNVLIEMCFTDESRRTRVSRVSV